MEPFIAIRRPRTASTRILSSQWAVTVGAFILKLAHERGLLGHFTFLCSTSKRAIYRNKAIFNEPLSLRSDRQPPWIVDSGA